MDTSFDCGQCHWGCIFVILAHKTFFKFSHVQYSLLVSHVRRASSPALYFLKGQLFSSGVRGHWPCK